MSAVRLPVSVVVAPGLEPLVVDELHRIGVRDTRIRRGGVGCSLTWPQLGVAHLQLRIATRVLVRVARFRARSFPELEAGLRAVDWPAWLPNEAQVTVKVASTGSQLYHEGAIAERVEGLLADRTGDGAGQAVYVRVQHDEVTVSLDASGESLHRRGWRRATDVAPLRETLAAALLVVSGWDRARPLVDPMCGSGTIAIEAALMARKMPPGRHRDFAFQHWPQAELVRWDRLVAAADADVIDRRVEIRGSDASAHAIEAARENAARAGVAEHVTFTVTPVSSVVLPPRPGWVVTNPPYGERVRGAGTAANDLAALLARAPGWRGAVIAPAPLVAGHLRGAVPVPADERIRVRNGGIDVELTRLAGSARPGG